MELNSLLRLKSLQIAMSDIELVPQNLLFESLLHFKVSIGHSDHFTGLWNFSQYERGLRLVMPRIIRPLPGWIKKLITEVDYLILCGIQNLNSIIRDLHDVDFNKVRRLEVIDCPGVSCLVDATDLADAQVFCNLEELELEGVGNLTQIIRGQLLPSSRSFCKLRHISIRNCNDLLSVLDSDILTSPLEGGAEICPIVQSSENTTSTSVFSNLKAINVSGCNNMRHVLSPSVAKRLLNNLSELFVHHCEKLERVVGVDKKEATAPLANFPSLTSIWLAGLPSLKFFCSEQHCDIVKYPALSYLIVDGCPNMEGWGEGIQATPRLKENNIRGSGKGMVTLMEGRHGLELKIFNPQATTRKTRQ